MLRVLVEVFQSFPNIKIPWASRMPKAMVDVFQGLLGATNHSLQKIAQMQASPVANMAAY
jgi:hypothetical protein